MNTEQRDEIGVAVKSWLSKSEFGGRGFKSHAGQLTIPTSKNSIYLYIYIYKFTSKCHSQTIFIYTYTYICVYIYIHIYITL